MFTRCFPSNAIFLACRHETCNTETGSLYKNTLSLVSLDSAPMFLSISFQVLILRKKLYCYYTTIITVIVLLNMQTLIWQVQGFLSNNGGAHKFSNTRMLFFALKSPELLSKPISFLNKIITECEITLRPFTVCVLGLSRHLRALVHSEWGASWACAISEDYMN